MSERSGVSIVWMFLCEYIKESTGSKNEGVCRLLSLPGHEE
jgi:hypothetical protein